MPHHTAAEQDAWEDYLKAQRATLENAVDALPALERVQESGVLTEDDAHDLLELIESAEGVVVSRGAVDGAFARRPI